MAATETIQIPLGYEAPPFILPDTVTGNRYSLEDLKGEKGTLIMFICNHCPYVIHVIDELIKLGNDYKEQGINLIAISSNDVENYPADHPDLMKKWADEKSFPFPYLYDETQKIAKVYQAACTPDFCIFDGDNTCVYRGQLDGSRPGSGKPVTGNDIRAAFDALIKGEEISDEQRPSIGCGIKWKK